MSIFAAMYNLRLLAKYLWHRMVANNRHGLHSPFVYRLVDKVIYDFYARNEYAELKSSYAKFRNDRKFTTPFKFWKLLYRLIADARPGAYMLVGHQDEFFRQVIRLASPQATEVAYSLSQPPKAADLIIADAATAGNLTAVIDDCLPHIHNGTVLIIQHLHQKKNGAQAWQQLKAHPRVTITINLFWLQMVYFRAGQVKEHFRVKY